MSAQLADNRGKNLPSDPKIESARSTLRGLVVILGTVSHYVAENSLVPDADRSVILNDIKR